MRYNAEEQSNGTHKIELINSEGEVEETRYFKSGTELREFIKAYVLCNDPNEDTKEV